MIASQLLRQQQDVTKNPWWLNAGKCKNISAFEKLEKFSASTTTAAYSPLTKHDSLTHSTRLGFRGRGGDGEADSDNKTIPIRATD